MTTVLDQSSPANRIAEIMSQGIQQNFPQGMQQGMQRGRLSQGIDRLKELSANKNISPTDLLLELGRVSQDIPERAFAPLAENLMKRAYANAENNAPVAGEQETAPQRDRTPIQRPEPFKPLPGIGKGQMGGMPGNLPPPSETGNLPQSSTTGKKSPLLNRQEKISEARDLKKQRDAAGIPTTMSEALKAVDESEQEKKDYNKTVDLETESIKNAQRDYNTIAEEKVKKLFPDAPEEIVDRMKRKAEEAAAGRKSEAEISTELTDEIKNIHDIVSGIKSDSTAPRLQNFHRKLLGTGKSSEQAANDLRDKIKPLWDLGLYDYSRGLLTDLGYYPEEREAILNQLSPKAISMINSSADATKENIKQKPISGMAGIPTTGGIKKEYTARDKDVLKEGIYNLYKNEPSTSLLLARKAFEDKGYDWRIFKDTLSQLMNDEQDPLNLNADQRKQLSNLDTPALSHLESILQHLNIIGR